MSLANRPGQAIDAERSPWPVTFVRWKVLVFAIAGGYAFGLVYVPLVYLPVITRQLEENPQYTNHFDTLAYDLMSSTLVAGFYGLVIGGLMVGFAEVGRRLMRLKFGELGGLSLGLVVGCAAMFVLAYGSTEWTRTLVLLAFFVLLALLSIWVLGLGRTRISSNLLEGA